MNHSDKSDYWACKRSRRSGRVREFTLILAAILSSPLFAADRYYIGPDNGSWNDSANWSATPGGPGGAGVPVAGDVVFVSPSVDTTVSYDTSIVAPGISFLNLSGALGATGAASQAAGTLTVSNQLIIGTAGGTRGAYTLSGGALNLTGDSFAGSAIIGQNGAGTLTMSAGTIFSNTVNVGLESGGTGTLNQSGGGITVGTNTPTGGRGFYVGRNAGSSGTYNLSAGSLLTYGNFVVGNEGTGNVAQNGGSIQVKSVGGSTGYMFLGNSASALGKYSISSGSVSVDNGIYVAGDVSSAGGSATFTASGNAQVTSPFMKVWAGGHVIGSGPSTLAINDFLLTSGGSVSGTGADFVFNNFTQTGGTHTLSNGAGLIVGRNAGSATYTQSDGTFTVGLGGSDEFLVLGNDAGSNGTYTMSGGTLAIASTRFVGGLIVGNRGTGTLNMSGSSHTNVVGAVTVGTDNGGRGTVNQTGGSFEIGSSTAGYSLFLGFGQGGAGTYTIGGPSDLTVRGNIQVGFGGSGTFIQNSGNVTLQVPNGNGGLVFIANSTTASGGYTIQSGTLNCAGVVVGGDVSSPGGPGSLTVNGGVVNGGLFVRPQGVVYLNGGTVNVGSDPLADNIQNDGLINNNGGTLVIGGRIYGTGTIGNESGNVVMANRTVLDSAMGFSGTGTGVVNGTLIVGQSSGSTGNLLLSGGSLGVNGVLGVGNNGTQLGGSGNGLIAVSAGTLNADSVYLGSSVGGVGIASFSGDSNVNITGDMNVGAGSGGSGTFTTGGTSQIVIRGGLTIGGLGGSGDVVVGGQSIVDPIRVRLNDLTVKNQAIFIVESDPDPSPDPVLRNSIVGGYEYNGGLIVKDSGTVISPFYQARGVERLYWHVDTIGWNDHCRRAGHR